MGFLGKLLGRRAPGVWYHRDYRVPLSSLEAARGIEPRRADYAAWYLVERGLLAASAVREPPQVTYPELALVHEEEYLESLSSPEVLARIFGVDPTDVPADALLTTVRLACGGTVSATREALRQGGAQFNLLGGFHHAFRARGGGACAVNDLAVAIAVVRREGFDGGVWVIDLDAHPPDGLADCLGADRRVHLSSISGSDWGPLEGVDETRLPPGTGDEVYLRALDALLARRPADVRLCFVIAGGDVLARDRQGTLALTLEGARARDARVARALARTPSVWVPGGGYRADSWKVLVGTALVLLGRPRRRISPQTDPLSLRFAGIASALPPGKLSDRSEQLSDEDLTDLFATTARRSPRLLDYYTAHGVEFALHRYGFLEHLGRLGYGSLRVALDATDAGDRMRLTGETPDGQRHVLVEVVVARRRVAGEEVLFVNWLTLRHPRASFSALRPPLPGQTLPGLGMARDAGELLWRMAQRLKLAGVAFRPSWYHMAYAAKALARFNDPARQGRFEALIRDLRGVPLLEATHAVAEGRLRMNGAPYPWEADEMVAWVDPSRARGDAEAVAAERERVRFTVEPAGSGPRAPPGR